MIGIAFWQALKSAPVPDYCDVHQDWNSSVTVTLNDWNTIHNCKTLIDDTGNPSYYKIKVNFTGTANITINVILLSGTIVTEVRDIVGWESWYPDNPDTGAPVRMNELNYIRITQIATTDVVYGWGTEWASNPN